MSNDEIQPVDERGSEKSDDSQERVHERSTSKEINEWFVDIKARLDKPDTVYPTEPSIFGNWQCWDDFGASFLTETQKWKFVACMTYCFGLNICSYLEYMQEKVDLAWSYYRLVDEQFRTAENNKRFIEHLLVNSCFLIFAMVLLSEIEDLTVIFYEIINKSILPEGLTSQDFQNIIEFVWFEPIRARSYTLTMNYQIPWFVVEAVYTELSNLSELFVAPIHNLAYFYCHGLYPVPIHKIDGCGTIPEGGFKHLLHIFHWSRTTDEKYLMNMENNLIGNFHIPSATELQLSQTVFMKDEDSSTDVSYCDGRIYGVLQLTPWHLLNYSTKLYESLLRFEDQYGYHCGLPFSSYVTCMASLLKTEADVKVLRANDIIPSTSFDDKNVLRCVQDFQALIDDSTRTSNELVILEKKVMAHHQKSAYRVFGEFKNRYCSNTWIIISVIAGILLFALTFIQTLYGTLSYYKQ